MVMEDDEGEILFVAGVLHSMPKTAFMDMKPAAKQFKRGIVRAIPLYREILSLYSVPVYALADNDIPGSERFLERVGFRFLANTDDGRLFVCCQQPS